MSPMPGARHSDPTGTTTGRADEHGPGGPWLALCPPGTVEVDVRRGWRALMLPEGTPVALLDGRPLGRRRLRRIARRLPMTVERELVVLPSASHPIVVLDDTKAAVRHFWTCVAAVPPGLVLTALPATLVLFLARRLPWSWTGSVAPGRVVVGRRT
jgi:hypothetical protein